MAEFWFHVFHNWASLFSLMSALYWGIAGLIVVTLAGYLGLLRRHFFLYKVLTFLYFIYIPVTFFVISLTYYAIGDLERAMNLALAQTRQGVVSTAVAYSEKALTPYLKGRITAYSIENISQSVQQSLEEQYAAPVPLEKVTIARVVEVDIPEYFRAIPQGTQHLLATKLASEVVQKINSGVKENSGVTRQTVHAVWTEHLKPEMEDTLVMHAAEDMIAELFASIYNHMYPFWLLLALPPLLEIIVYQIFVVRSRRKQMHLIERRH